jgi:hypothetical protein
MTSSAASPVTSPQSPTSNLATPANPSAPSEEHRKESRLLHHCHLCNKGFKGPILQNFVSAENFSENVNPQILDKCPPKTTYKFR